MTAARETSHARKQRRKRENERLAAVYGNKCGVDVCQKGPSERRALDVDHDHATGRLRGLLCHVHNRRLWRGATSAELYSMARYMERFEQTGGLEP